MTKNYFIDFDREWATISACRWTRRRVTAWRHDHPSVHGCYGLADIVTAIQTRDLEDSRQVCWTLLTFTKNGDELAARTMLQAVIPGLVTGRRLWSDANAHWHGSDTDGSGDPYAMQLGADATQAIYEQSGTTPDFPISAILRRTRQLALRRIRIDRRWAEQLRTGRDNQPLDTRFAALTHAGPTGAGRPSTRPTVRSQSSTPARIDATFHPTVSRSSGTELAAVLNDACANGLLSRRDASIIWLTRSAGYRPAEIAADYDLTPDAMRRARHRAEAHIVRHAHRLSPAS